MTAPEFPAAGRAPAGESWHWVAGHEPPDVAAQIAADAAWAEGYAAGYANGYTNRTKDMERWLKSREKEAENEAIPGNPTQQIAGHADGEAA